jgi:hypothetical protein
MFQHFILEKKYMGKEEREQRKAENGNILIFRNEIG